MWKHRGLIESVCVRVCVCVFCERVLNKKTEEDWQKIKRKSRKQNICSDLAISFTVPFSLQSFHSNAAVPALCGNRKAESLEYG